MSYKDKYLNLKNQQGLGYVLENNEIRKFNNMNLYKTLGSKEAYGILNNTMTQHNVNKHLLTGILTVNNRILNNEKEEFSSCQGQPGLAGLQ